MSLPFLDCNPSLFLASSQPFSRRLHTLSFSFSQTSNMSLPFLDCNPSLFLASSQPVCRRGHNRLHIFCWYSNMGQVLGRLQGKLWRQKQVRQITERVFDRIKNDSGRANLKFEDLYIAVLLVFNDINKLLPGPHFDPPSKEHVRTMIQICDLNLDGEIDLEEFVAFIQQLTTETFIAVSQGLIITLLVVPIIAVATKNAIESVPGCGKMVKKLPYSIYAFLVTLAVVFIQRLIFSCLDSK
ncbi:hypothetical protein I3843_01G064700 [Carya illinoinensis]|nr:uncharacterized protein LOC122310625 [Carya illinoinensis]KAG7994579.1 hypothetical protein I3843_01G064700 [Carya illinoinensis]